MNLFKTFSFRTSSRLEAAKCRAFCGGGLTAAARFN
jgi:hypothetical protein